MFDFVVTLKVDKSAICGLYEGTHKEAVQTEASALADKLKNATQKVLQAIQLSSELPQRATVRRCLDDLNILLAMITESAALCASGWFLD